MASEMLLGDVAEWRKRRRGGRKAQVYVSTLNMNNSASIGKFR